MSRTWHKDRVEKARGSKRFDSSCANHGSCSYCKNNRTFFDTKHREAADDDIKAFERDECSVCDDEPFTFIHTHSNIAEVEESSTKEEP